MKKWVFVVMVVLVASFILLDFLLPSPQTVTVYKNIKASTPAVYRVVSNQQSWDKFARGEFSITERLVNTVHINTFVKNGVQPGEILLIPLTPGSVSVRWKCNVEPRGGFLQKIPGFIAAKKLKNKLNNALDGLESFSTNWMNTYGLDLIQTSTTDTSLVTARFTTSTYPSNGEIYAHIKKLEEFAALNNAKQVSYPMLNVSTDDSITFKCRVALPIDRKIVTDVNAPIAFIRMVPAQFISAEVRGGPRTIQQAHKMIQLYFQEYKRTAMAIPFEYLVTDRLKETDTSKWVTRIYVPVY